MTTERMRRGIPVRLEAGRLVKPFRPIVSGADVQLQDEVAELRGGLDRVVEQCPAEPAPCLARCDGEQFEQRTVSARTIARVDGESEPEGIRADDGEPNERPVELRSSPLGDRVVLTASVSCSECLQPEVDAGPAIVRRTGSDLHALRLSRQPSDMFRIRVASSLWTPARRLTLDSSSPRRGRVTERDVGRRTGTCSEGRA
nr:hypothetical protein [Rathayibacter sp. AY1D3]